MGRKYIIRNQEKIYFVTFTVVNWIDVYIREPNRDIFYETIQFCQKEKGLEIYAYCIMTSHIHLNSVCKKTKKTGFSLILAVFY